MREGEQGGGFSVDGAVIRTWEQISFLLNLISFSHAVMFTGCMGLDYGDWFVSCLSMMMVAGIQPERSLMEALTQTTTTMTYVTHTQYERLWNMSKQSIIPIISSILLQATPKKATFFIEITNKRVTCLFTSAGGVLRRLLIWGISTTMLPDREAFTVRFAHFRFFVRYIWYGSEVESETNRLYGDVTLVANDGTLIPVIFLLVHLFGCSLTFDTLSPLPLRYTDKITRDIFTHIIKSSTCACMCVRVTETPTGDVYKRVPCFMGILHIQQLEKDIGRELLGGYTVPMTKDHWTHRVALHFSVVGIDPLDPRIFEVLYK
jgi:hypothetical protein